MHYSLLAPSGLASIAECCPAREKSYGQCTGLFGGISSSPRSPRDSFRSASLHHFCCCCAQEGVFRASLLSFSTSFSQLSRYGLATPSSHDGCCAGAPFVHRVRWFPPGHSTSPPTGAAPRPPLWSRLSPFCILYSVIVLRGNGVIHRGQKPASRG
jgi:hypothetical protein